MFPSDKVFTGLTCDEKSGFSYTTISGKDRPLVMIGPEPVDVVRDKKAIVSCGLLQGLVRPETQTTVAALRRLANSVSDANCEVDLNDVVVPELRPPQLPANQCIHVEIRLANDESTKPVVYPGAVLLTSGSHGSLFVDTRCEASAMEVKALGTSSAMENISEATELARGHVSKILNGGSKYTVHYRPLLAQRGVLLELPASDGPSQYCVLAQWKEDVVAGEVRFYNPDTSGHLGVVDKVRSSEVTSVWTQAESAQFFLLPPRLALQYMVPVGTRVYLHAESVDALSILGDAASFIGYEPDENIIPHYGRVPRGASCQDFKEKVEDSDLYTPVIEVTVLYEMPAQMICNATSGKGGAVIKSETGVYVGVTTTEKRKDSRDLQPVHYAVVSARSLVSTSRSEHMRTTLVPFAFFC